MSYDDYTYHVSAQDMLDQLVSAQVACVSAEDKTGLHIHFADGRVLVVVGLMDGCLGVQVLKTERLH